MPTCSECRVSHICLSANDNGVKPGTVHRLQEFTLRLRKSPENLNLMKDVRPVIASNAIPYLKMRSVGSHTRQRKRTKERVIHCIRIIYFYYLFFHRRPTHKLWLSIAQARRQKKLQDLLKMSHYRRKAYRKENTTCEWDEGGKIGN